MARTLASTLREIEEMSREVLARSAVRRVSKSSTSIIIISTSNEYLFCSGPISDAEYDGLTRKKKKISDAEYDGALIIAGKPAIFSQYNEQSDCDAMNG